MIGLLSSAQADLAAVGCPDGCFGCYFVSFKQHALHALAAMQHLHSIVTRLL
jgi:hypothetical protein